MSRRFQIKRGGARGFTLIELLVVIGIIGVLMAMILPSFRGFGRSASMRGSVAQMKSTLALARQYAINKRQTVDILFMTSNTVATRPADKWRAYRSYAVFVATNGGLGYYVKEWTALPPGVVFSPDATSFTGANAGNNVLGNLSLDINRAFPDSGSTSTALVRYIQFESDGKITDGTRPDVFMMEGTVDTNGVLNIRTNGMRFRLENMNLTGQTRIHDYSK